MKDFLQLYLKRLPTNIILHIDTNNSINDSLSVIPNKLLLLKNFINTELPEPSVIFSNMIGRLGMVIARLKISNFNKILVL